MARLSRYMQPERVLLYSMYLVRDGPGAKGDSKIGTQIPCV